MKTPAHEIVTADMRGLKAALVARAQAERVSVSAVVRWAVESELVRVGMARECSLCSHRDHSGGRAECVRSTQCGPTSRVIRRRIAVLQRPKPRRPDGTWTCRQRGQPLHALKRCHHQVHGVPSRQGVFSLSTACSAALRWTRSMVSAGRVMSRRSCSSAWRSSAPISWPEG